LDKYNRIIMQKNPTEKYAENPTEKYGGKSNRKYDGTNMAERGLPSERCEPSGDQRGKE
jgi:hypothetical protein